MLNWLLTTFDCEKQPCSREMIQLPVLKLVTLLGMNCSQAEQIAFNYLT